MDINKSIEKILERPKSTILRNLDLSDQSLEELPSQVLKVENLGILDLSDNALSVLCEGLCDLSSLEELNVAHNFIAELQNVSLNSKNYVPLIVLTTNYKGFL